MILRRRQATHPSWLSLLHIDKFHDLKVSSEDSLSKVFITSKYRVMTEKGNVKRQLL